MPVAKKNDGPIQLVRVPTETVIIPIIGTSPLIVHNWSEKSKRQMLEKQMAESATRAKKDPKNPQEDYESSRYLLEDGTDGFPSTGFKASLVGACRLFDGLPMTRAKTSIFVGGIGGQQLVPIVGKPSMREDMVRLESGVADIRFRAEFWPWSAELNIKYLPSMLSVSSLIALVDAAGLGGIGEWRPSAPKTASGSYGMFEVDVERLGS